MEQFQDRIIRMIDILWYLCYDNSIVLKLSGKSKAIIYFLNVLGSNPDLGDLNQALKIQGTLCVAF